MEKSELQDSGQEIQKGEHTSSPKKRKTPHDKSRKSQQIQPAPGLTNQETKIFTPDSENNSTSHIAVKTALSTISQTELSSIIKEIKRREPYIQAMLKDAPHIPDSVIKAIKASASEVARFQPILSQAYVQELSAFSNTFSQAFTAHREALNRIEGLMSSMSSQIAEASSRMTRSIVESLKPAFVVRLEYIDHIHSLSQGVLASRHFASVWDILPVIDSPFKKFITTFLDLSKSYRNALPEFVDQTSSVLAQPPYMFNYPVESYYRTVEIVQDIIPDTNTRETEEQQESHSLLTAPPSETTISLFIHDINPSLVPLYQGANDAFHSTNRDRYRHFAISFRELLTHLIHTLATDDMIKAWSTEPKTDFDKNGKPTRSARFRFIFRHIASGPLRDYCKKDIQATIELFDLLNKISHEIETQQSEMQIEFFKEKIEAAIYFILKAAQGIL